MPGTASIRVFLDSNVIFSGLYSDKGPPGIILQQAAEGGLEVVISRQVLDELVRTIAEKLPEALPLLLTFLSNTPMEICKDPVPSEIDKWSKVIGADDAPIAAAAYAAKPDFLVSGDNHFLKIGKAAEKKGLRILSPSDFLAVTTK